MTFYRNMPPPVTGQPVLVSSASSYTHVTFPQVRTVVPTMISQSIVSVQPMKMPGERYPCTSQEEFNRLFRMTELFNQMCPIGSHVNKRIGSDGRKNTSGILSWLDFTYGSNPKTTLESDRLIVKSEAYVLMDSSAVGFLTNESSDEGDYFCLDQFVEYESILKAIKDGK